MKKFSPSNFLLIVVLSLIFSNNSCTNDEKSKLTLEITTKGETEKLEFYTDSFDKIGINDTLGKTRVEILFDPKNHKMLKEITQKNIGNNITIKFGTETLASGAILEPLNNGYISIFTESKEEAEQVIKKMGRAPDYYLGFTPEELEDAERYLKPANNPWIKKAVVQLTSKNNKKAEEYVKKAIEDEPLEPSHYAMLGAIYIMQGKNDLAFEQLLEAEKLIKNKDIRKYPGIYRDIGKFYTESGRFNEAVEIYKKYLSFDDNNLSIRLDLAEVYEKMGDYKSAVKEYTLLSKSDDEYFKKIGLKAIESLKRKDL